MGSPTKDFVLGFFPLQVARRANGTGGTYEPTGEDELTQLQRLIDYGVISGMTSPADVAARGLTGRKSQGTRKARTDEGADRAGVHGRQLRALPQPARLAQRDASPSSRTRSTSCPTATTAASSSSRSSA